MRDPWYPQLMAQPTQSKFYTMLHKVMINKHREWTYALRVLGESYKKAHENFQATLKAKAARSERNWAALLFVLDVALAGALAYAKAAIPKAVVAPVKPPDGGFGRTGFGRTASGLFVPNHMLSDVGKGAPGRGPGTLRDFIGKTTGDLQNWLEEAWRAAAWEVGDKVVSAARGKVATAVKQGKPGGSPIVTVKDKPLDYHPRYETSLIGVFNEFEKGLIKLSSPPAVKEPALRYGVKQNAIKVAQKTVFWNSPSRSELDRAEIEKEFERCLWALWMRTRWTVEITTADSFKGHGSTRPQKQTGGLAATESRARARAAAIDQGDLTTFPDTDISDVGPDVARALEGLGMKSIGGEKPTELTGRTGWFETDEDTRKFIVWGENYLKKPKKTFGKALSNDVIYPWPPG